MWMKRKTSFPLRFKMAAALCAAMLLPSLDAVAFQPSGNLVESLVGMVASGAKPKASSRKKGSRKPSKGGRKAKASAQEKAGETRQEETRKAEATTGVVEEIPEEMAKALARLPDPADILDRLYGAKRLGYDGGEPVLSVRLMDGQDEIALVPKGRSSVLDGGGKGGSPVAPGTELVFRLSDARPAEIAYLVTVGEFRVSDKPEREKAIALWKSRGFQTRTLRTGGRFGVSGQVVDTRRDLVALEGERDEASARRFLREVQEKHGGGSYDLAPVLKRRPQGRILVTDRKGRKFLEADTAAVLRPEAAGALTTARRVEHDMGYAAHGRQDRTYRGELAVAVDAQGRLALVNVVKMEEYIRGIVPSEIFASAHQEALKAQAVTARGEVLAKLGKRHMGDPYLLCAEQHCQVYTGVAGETAGTDRAVKATAGEFLFDGEGRLVDSTYSAVCGGHTEDNDVVWGGIPSNSLRGRRDGDDGSGEGHLDLKKDEDLHRFLAAPPRSYCATASLASSSKFRWEKRFSQKDVDEIASDLGVGHVLAMRLSDRGVSGRAATLTISGDRGVRQVKGELNIRRRFRNLNSTMAEVIAPEGASGEWVFRGGGWGHGVGMCQIGAIGRAEAGQDYRRILGHYFSGARTVRVYGEGDVK